MAQKIFYGAGQYAAYNLSRWIKNGEKPVCFADADERKWNKVFKYPNGGSSEQFHVLPLKEAIKKYPDYEIVITVAMQNRNTVYEYLVSNLVSRERVRYIYNQDVEFRKGCHFIGKFWHIAGGISFTCCYPKRQGVKLAFDKGQCCIKRSYEKYREMCLELIEGLKSGTRTSCDGCPELTRSKWESNPILESIDLATGFKGDRCNISCYYCNATGCLETAKGSGVSAYDFYSELRRLPGLDNVVVNFANGEPTVNPDIDSILSMWEEKKFKGTVATNAVLYKEKLGMLMKQGVAQIICSLDCGTRESYIRIKGVDKFDIAVANLKKYAQCGEVVLKYILLPDINDNLEDVGGFFEIAREINAEIVLDKNKMEAIQQNSYVHAAVLNLIDKISKEKGIRYNASCI